MIFCKYVGVGVNAEHSGSPYTIVYNIIDIYMHPFYYVLNTYTICFTIPITILD